jgi:D-alanyl-D-alanine dipeptidase
MLLEDDYTTAYQGFDPNSPESFIFFNLMRSSHFENSLLFAEEVDRQLRKTGFAVSNYTGIHQDPFWVLWRTSMPAVLLELGFITNSSDLAVLKSEKGREDITNKLFDAFSAYKTYYDSSIDTEKQNAKPEAKPAPQPAPKPEADNFDKKMREYGLVDIRTLDKNILVELKYSTTDNFVGKDMYGSLVRAYLEPSFAQRVLKAQKLLRKRYPKYTLLVYDAARPISVQRTMKQIVAGTEFDSFVASGTKGGRHNYGVAVDLTIATNQGEPLDMGAGFDDFTDAAAVKGTSDTNDQANRNLKVYTEYVNGLVKRGLISRQAANNRLLLIEVMIEAQLYPYRREWWHYEELLPMSEVREKRRLLDF